MDAWTYSGRAHALGRNSEIELAEIRHSRTAANVDAGPVYTHALPSVPFEGPPMTDGYEPSHSDLPAFACRPHPPNRYTPSYEYS